MVIVFLIVQVHALQREVGRRSTPRAAMVCLTSYCAGACVAEGGRAA